MDFPKTLTSSFFPKKTHPFTIILASTNRYCIIKYYYYTLMYIYIILCHKPRSINWASLSVPLSISLTIPFYVVGTPSFPWANYKKISIPQSEMNPIPRSQPSSSWCFLVEMPSQNCSQMDKQVLWKSPRREVHSIFRHLKLVSYVPSHPITSH